MSNEITRTRVKISEVELLTKKRKVGSAKNPDVAIYKLLRKAIVVAVKPPIATTPVTKSFNFSPIVTICDSAKVVFLAGFGTIDTMPIFPYLDQLLLPGYANQLKEMKVDDLDKESVMMYIKLNLQQAEGNIYRNEAISFNVNFDVMKKEGDSANAIMTTTSKELDKVRDLLMRTHAASVDYITQLQASKKKIAKLRA